MLAACLQGCEEVIRHIGLIWQVMNESSKEELLLNMGSAKDTHGVRERFAKETCLFAKNGLQIKEFRSTAIYIYNT